MFVHFVRSIRQRCIVTSVYREWMRICFELLDMLKAHKKGIRRATVNTFGYIAKVSSLAARL